MWGRRGLLLVLLTTGSFTAGMVVQGRTLDAPAAADAAIEPDGIAEELRGIRLREHLGTLYTLTGQEAGPPAAELEVWVVVGEQECVSCLFRLPELAARVREAAGLGAGLALAALGDRLEARRALLGWDLGMPVYSTPRGRLTGQDTDLDTPMVLIAWAGRVVETVPWSDARDRPLADRTVEALARWMTAGQDRVLRSLPPPPDPG